MRTATGLETQGSERMTVRLGCPPPIEEEYVEIEGERVPVAYHGLFPEVMYAFDYSDSRNYHFAGFDFRFNEIPKDAQEKYGTLGHMCLDAILHNPEGKAYLSYHNVATKGLWTKELAAAWLIAHWWEHFMHNCPCQVDDNKKSNFRWHFIETLLYLEGVPLGM